MTSKIGSNKACFDLDEGKWVMVDENYHFKNKLKISINNYEKSFVVIISLLPFTFSCSSTYKLNLIKIKLLIGILLIKMNGELFTAKL